MITGARATVVPVTTVRDPHDSVVEMLQCPVGSTTIYPSLVLALRDMRTANGRNPVTGDGAGNESWIGLSLGMVVLDTLTPASEPVGQRWRRLLTDHGIDDEDGDATIIYALRNSLLHGYGLPKPEDAGNRRVGLTAAQEGWAVDTRVNGEARVSVPLFCGRLIERIVAEAPRNWDTSLIDTNYRYGS